MWALLQSAISLSLFLLTSALAVGVLGGLGVTVWRCSRAIRRFSHELFTSAGEWLVNAGSEFLRAKLPLGPVAKMGESRLQLKEQITSLEDELSKALGKASEQADLVRTLRAELKAKTTSEHTSLYARVGLHADSEEFLIRAARNAFRKRFHPDVCRVADVAEATRRFQEAETSFEAIYKLRRWS